MREKTNGNDTTDTGGDEAEKNPTAFPLKWVFYLILGYIFLQTFYIWYHAGAD